MICPKCGRKNVCRVVDSREKKDGVVRRRRECTVCGCRYTTMEKVTWIYTKRKGKYGKSAGNVYHPKGTGMAEKQQAGPA